MAAMGRQSQDTRCFTFLSQMMLDFFFFSFFFNRKEDSGNNNCHTQSSDVCHCSWQKTSQLADYQSCSRVMFRSCMVSFQQPTQTSVSATKYRNLVTPCLSRACKCHTLKICTTASRVSGAPPQETI